MLCEIRFYVPPSESKQEKKKQEEKDNPDAIVEESEANNEVSFQ